MERLPVPSRGFDPTPNDMASDAGSSCSGRSASLYAEKKSLSQSLTLSSSHSQMKALFQASATSSWRSSDQLPTSRSPEKLLDKARASLSKDVHKQLMMEHEERNLAEAAMHKDLQRRVEDTREKVCQMEVKLQEAMARMETRLSARDEDLAELREELRTGRPTLPAWSAEEHRKLLAAGKEQPPEQPPEEAAAEGAGCAGAPEEAGPGLAALAADLAELRRSLAAEIQEQARQHAEAYAGVSAHVAVLEQHLQDGLERLGSSQGETLSENIVLRRRVACVESDLRQALDAAVQPQRQEGQRAEQAGQPSEVAPGAEGAPRESIAARGPSTGAAWRPRRPGMILDNLAASLESVQEGQEAEEDRADTPQGFVDPRLSILKGSELDSSSSSSPALRRAVGTSDVSEARQEGPSPSSGVVRRTAGDLAEVMRLRRERCQEWVSPDRPRPEALATSPALCGVGAAAEGVCVQEKQERRPSLDLTTSVPDLAPSACEAIDCGEEESHEPSDTACLPSVERLRALEGRLDAGDRRLDDLQASLGIEIGAIRDLMEAMPTQTSSQLPEAEFHRLAAETAALAARLAALEQRAEAAESRRSGDQDDQHAQLMELIARVDLMAAEAAARPPPERGQAPPAEEPRALGQRVSALEARLEEDLREVRKVHDAEFVVLRSRVEAVEGSFPSGEHGARPPEQCPEAMSPDRARGEAVLPQVDNEVLAKEGKEVKEAKEADAADDEIGKDIEELGRLLSTSDSRIEALMKRMMVESEEEAEQKSAGQEAARAREPDQEPAAAQAPTPPALSLPVVPAEEPEQGSETHRVLEDLRSRLTAEAAGLREQLEVHSERCDQRMRELHEEQAEQASEALRRAEEAMVHQHNVEVSRSAAQRALLEGEQRRLAAEAGSFWQRLEALEATEGWECQAGALWRRLEALEESGSRARAVDGSLEPAAGRESFALAFGSVPAGLGEAPAPPGPFTQAPTPAAAAGEALPHEELAVLRERVEALAGEHGEQLVRAEEHQEALECLQGQVGVLETCLEDNDGKLGEIQTTLLQARLEGLVATDERLKSIEWQIQANDRKLVEATTDLSQHSAQDERLAALERCVEDVRRRVDAADEAPRASDPPPEGLLTGRPRPQPLRTFTPSPEASEAEDHAREFRPVHAASPADPEDPPLTAVPSPACTVEVLSSEHLQELRRYVDERLRRLQRAQEDHLADVAALRQRMDSASQRGPSTLQAVEAQKATDAADAPLDTSVDERLQALEGKCSTMLGLLLRL